MPSVGKPIPHDSAIGHVTGTAWYIDDLPLRRRIVREFCRQPCGERAD